jgi:aldehyde dehydrogenase (NAD+)
MDLIRKTFDAQITARQVMSVAERKQHLRKIHDWIHQNRELIHKAMKDDLGKPATEVDSTELFHVLNELKLALEKVDDWTQPKKVDAPLTMIGTRSFIQYEPRGVCLIISPWNYPFSLSVGPLVSALAAGNTVIIKPSEMTPSVSAVIKKFAADLFQEKIVSVFEGGPDVSQYLLSLPFDHIFFTGSPSIGKLVMKAAAENLTSVTLELGGKTPTIVTESARVSEAAKRISIAKFINNGQTCVAPDYVIVHEKISEHLIAEIIRQTKENFCGNAGDFETADSYGRIVNEKHFERLATLFADAKATGCDVRFDGALKQSEKFFHPVVISNIGFSAKVMNEEIFGPILPVLTYTNLDEVITLINSKPKPLALYIFGTNKNEHWQILNNTSSGGVCINDCAIQFLHHNLPFGGINNSGHGKSHGHAGFLSFSHEKSVLKQKKGFTSVQVFYPPYTKLKKIVMEWFLKLF